MPRQVDVLQTEVLAQEGEFRLERARFRYERFDGEMSDDVVRVNFERGDSVAGVVHVVDRDAVILTEQFRYPAHRNGPGWMRELPAGMVTAGSGGDPVADLRRELLEEIGYDASELRQIGTFYASVGASSERIHLYYVSVTTADRVAPGGGCADAGEDIRRVELALNETFRQLDAGEIVDAKTIIGLQWLRNEIGRRSGDQPST